MVTSKRCQRVVALVVCISISACAGRTANPTASYRVGDDAMTCTEIKAEMAHVQSQVDALIPESKKTGKNVALGVAGWFLLVPWFFMDFSEAEKVEIKAYQERYLALEKLYARRDCARVESGEITETSSLTSDINSAEGNSDSSSGAVSPQERLRVIQELLDQGLITEEEYNERRQDVLNSL